MSHLMSLSGVKRTTIFATHMSAFDPKRTVAIAWRHNWEAQRGPLAIPAITN